MDCIEAYNKIEPLRREFDVRLYRWSEEDLHREIDSGFRWIKRVKSGRAFHYLEFLLSLPPHKRSDAAFAILRNCIVHRKARAQLGLKLTDSEENYVAEYNRRFYPVALLSKHEIALRDQHPAEEFEIDRESLEKMLEPQIARALGQSPNSSRALSFMQPIDGWFVKTGIDVHSIYQLRYGHTIVARGADDFCPIQLHEGSVSFLGWLGIDPTTTFDLLRHVDLTLTAEFMAEVIHHFVSSLPPLLKGLNNTISAELSIERMPDKKLKRK